MPDPEPEEETRIPVSHRRLVAKTGAVNRYQIPKVFTIFCHGTGGHRDGRCLELISEFSLAYWRDGYDPFASSEQKFYWNNTDAFFDEHYTKDFLILDGVGTADMAQAGPDSASEPYYTSKPKEVGLAGAELPLPNINPMPGDFVPNDPSCLTPPFAKPLKDEAYRTSKHISIPKSGKHRGDIMGDGWDDNVAHALYVLHELHANADEQFPFVINLIGWSRGAITTIKLANAIYAAFSAGQGYTLRENDSNAGGRENPRTGEEIVPTGIKLEGLAVNIFAIDPVPGRFGKKGDWRGSSRKAERFPEQDWDCHNLPPIVNDCIVTLAMDERRAGFVPVDLDKMTFRDGQSEHQNVVFLPFPGIHRTQLRTEPRDPTGSSDAHVRRVVKSVPHLVFDLAWSFLCQHGTKFRTDYMAVASRPFGGGLLTLEQVVDKYSNVMNNRASYHEARNQGLMQRGQGGFADRKFTDRGGKHDLKHMFPDSLTPYVRDRRWMINDHHRACFEAAYPLLYRWLFTPDDAADTAPDDPSSGDRIDAETALGSELAAIDAEFSSTATWLASLGFIPREVRGDAPSKSWQVPPRGRGVCASSADLHAMPGDVTEMGLVRPSAAQRDGGASEGPNDGDEVIDQPEPLPETHYAGT